MGDLLRKNSEAVRKRIENHAFSDEAGEEYEGSEFGKFGDYFRRKKIKLQNLDAELRASSEAAAKPQIFKGVVAHVTGYTQPPLHVLHKELVQHGAGFLQYLDSKTMATHIIASSMPPRKVIDFTKYRIVKPAWVTDSIAAGKLLPWSDYRVIDDGPRQKTIQFDGARMFSQSAQQSPRGYREQTENSFYTSQFKQKSADSSSPAVPSSASKSSPFARAPVEGIQDEDELDMDDEDDPLEDDDMATPSHTTAQKPSHQDSKESEQLPDETSKPPPPPQQPPEIPLQKPQQQKSLTSEEHNALLLTDPHIRKASTANPDFLKQYYSESRLHHLSTWKAQLKSRMQALAAQRSSSQKPVTATKRKPNSRRYILHVDFDSFFCAVSLKKAPEYVDKPAVVAHGSGQGSEIASCNYPARKFGVKNGMWMKRAMELCPDLKVLPYDFPGYEEASKQFYDAILDVGGVVQSVSIDEALVDVTGIVLKQTGSDGTGISEGSLWREQEVVDGIARNLRERIKENTGCNVSVGIGGNILLAKVALRKAKPAGQYQIRPEEVLDILAELKVDDLPGVAYSISSRLEEIGIKFVKDIRETSKEKLVSTLGPKTGEKLWDYARGIDRAEVGEQPIRKSVSADVNWGIRFISQEEAEEFVRNLSKELERRLLNEGVKGKHLSMKIMRRAADAPLDPPKHLGHGKCDTFNKSVAFGVATNNWEMIGKEAVAILRSYRFSPGDLRGLGLQMTKLEPLKPSTSNLGPDGSSQKKLNFGNAAVKRPRPEPIDQEGGSKRFKAAPASSENESDPITEDPLTPRKPKVHPAIALSRAREADEKARTPLNISGTQFIIPTCPDPEVLAELPNDIRTKLLNQAKAKKSREASPAITSNNTSRSHSPALIANDTSTIPADIDPEVFNALPDDVKAEVLAQYRQQQQPPQPQPQQDTAIRPGRQTILPQSPRKNRILGRPKEKPSPTKRHAQGGSGNVKSLFARAAGAAQQQQQLPQTTTTTTKNEPSNFDLPEGIDPDFLSELPPDVRQEILSEHFRAQKSKQSLKVKAQSSTTTTTTNTASNARAHHQKITFPAAPPKITFSKKGVYSTPQVREMISAWHNETQRKGPHEGDVDMLERYLRNVVLEERDLEKVGSLVKYLGWIIEEGTDEGGGEGKRLWVEALGRIRKGVDKALGERGLGAMFGTGTSTD
ncbi:DNA repair protein rev1 [Naviculisporaceae sp. PSN 640]